MYIYIWEPAPHTACVSTFLLTTFLLITFFFAPHTPAGVYLLLSFKNDKIIQYNKIMIR